MHGSENLCNKDHGHKEIRYKDEDTQDQDVGKEDQDGQGPVGKKGGSR